MKTSVKTKTDLCTDLYSKNKNITPKEIAKKVGCDVSLVYRTLGYKNIKNKLLPKQVIEFINQNYISKNQFRIEEITKNYNNKNKTKYTINQFNNCLKHLVDNSCLTKTGRGLYNLKADSKVIKKRTNMVSICAANYILDNIKNGNLTFTLSGLTSKYPYLDSVKLKKVVQNWAYNEKYIDGHRLVSTSPGNYSISKTRESNRPFDSRPFSGETNLKAIEIAASLYKMVGHKDSVKLIEVVHNIHGK